MSNVTKDSVQTASYNHLLKHKDTNSGQGGTSCSQSLIVFHYLSVEFYRLYLAIVSFACGLSP